MRRGRVCAQRRFWRERENLRYLSALTQAFSSVDMPLGYVICRGGYAKNSGMGQMPLLRELKGIVAPPCYKHAALMELGNKRLFKFRRQGFRESHNVSSRKNIRSEPRYAHRDFISRPFAEGIHYLGKVTNEFSLVPG